jgi:hypothetical protein
LGSPPQDTGVLVPRIEPYDLLRLAVLLLTVLGIMALSIRPRATVTPSQPEKFSLGWVGEWLFVLSYDTSTERSVSFVSRKVDVMLIPRFWVSLWLMNPCVSKSTRLIRTPMRSVIGRL